MTHNPTREEAWTILTDHVGVPLEEQVADTIEGMKTVAEAIGLKGNPGGSP